MVKKAVQTGVRNALKDKKSAHRTSSTATPRYYDDNNENYYNNQNEILSGSGSDSDGSGRKMKTNRNINLDKDDKSKGRKGTKKDRQEEDKNIKLKDQKSSHRKGGKFPADYTGPTGLLHARGYGQGADKETCYAGGTYALYLRCMINCKVPFFSFLPFLHNLYCFHFPSSDSSLAFFYLISYFTYMLYFLLCLSFLQFLFFLSFVLSLLSSLP